MAFDKMTYAMSRKYTEETVIGAGALKGEKGEKGDKGDTGEVYVPKIGTVTTLEADEAATVQVRTNSETYEAFFDFGLPKGGGEVEGLTSEQMSALIGLL